MWYMQGSVTVTNGQRLVTGAGTDFVSNVLAGQGFVGPDGRVNEVEQVVSATQLLLRTAYLSATAAGAPYAIFPTQSLAKDLVERIGELIGSFATARDTFGAGLIPDGNPASPAMRFIDDQDTGWRRYGDNIMSFVTGGADRLVIGNNGVAIGGPNNDGKGALLVQGNDQATAALADGGAHGASIFLRAIGTGSGDGGALLLGTTFGEGTPFAAIKGAVSNGNTRTMGDIIFASRAEVTDAALTERARLTAAGALGLGANPLWQCTVKGVGQSSAAPVDAGAKGGSLYLQSDSLIGGSGGALLLGAINDKPFGAIKGFLTNGGSNTTGDIILSTRNSADDNALTPRWSWTAAGHYRPYVDNAYDIASASERVRVIYAATGTINTSDARNKQQIGAIPADWLDAWGDVRHVRFKFKDSVAEKGEQARWHVGYIAQEIRDAFEARNLDATVIGLLCHNEWSKETGPEYVTEMRTKRTPRAIPSAGGLLDASGHPLVTWTYDETTEPVEVATGKTIVTREAGDLWSIRPDECAAIEAAWQRREIDRMAARLDALEQAQAA